MFGLGPATKIYVAAEAVDMRKGFEGLYGLVREQLGQDPLSGHLFLLNQSHAHAPQSAGVGWKRTVGMCETAGARPISLAGSERGSERVDAARRTGDVDQRNGPGASAPAVELVS
jgi:hypothetical protein